MLMISPSTRSCENVTDVMQVITLKSMVRAMFMHVIGQESQYITLDTMVVLPCERTCHAVEQTVAIGRNTNDAELFSRVMVDEAVNRHLMKWTRIGSFAESAVWHLPSCKRCCYRRLSARFM